MLKNDIMGDSEIRKIIKESINRVLLEKNELKQQKSFKQIITERQGLRSQKLFDIIKQHGGIKTNRGIFDLHNMSDNDVLDVVDYRGLKEFENNKPKVSASDEIEYIPLNDGYYIIALCRGCRFDRVYMPDRKREPGDFEDLYQKISNRQRNKQNSFHWIDRDAEELFKNPYFRAGEGNWTPSRKTEVMNALRNRKK